MVNIFTDHDISSDALHYINNDRKDTPKDILPAALYWFISPGEKKIDAAGILKAIALRFPNSSAPDSSSSMS